MPTINGRACVVNGVAVDKVFSNGRQVYGRNLQTGTGDCSFPIATYNATVAIENYDDRTKMFHAKGSGGFYTSYNVTSFVPTVGKTYTLSADLKGSGTTGGNLFKYEGADRCSLGTVTLTNNWQRISNTVHIGIVRGQWIFYLNQNVGDFYVKHVKIERGSVATPWTPAPEDVGVKYKALEEQTQDIK